jgi:N-acetylglutamate synthase-like GNAT family acetyltransferase
MKKSLLTLLLASASLHAMKDIRIVPFDYDAHQAMVNALHAKVLPEYAKPIIFETKLPMLPTESCQVLLKDETLIGYIYHTIKQDESRTKSIKALAIDPAYQTKGYGALLLHGAQTHALENNCKRISLSAVLKVIPFYEKHGFSKAEQELTTSNDQCVMVKELIRHQAKKQKLDT